MSGGEQQSNKGYPLKHTYYFSLKGRIVPAREKTIKKEVKPDMKVAFKNLMEDRWWSWNDVPSLEQLFLYFPELRICKTQAQLNMSNYSFSIPNLWTRAESKVGRFARHQPIAC